MTRIQDPEGVEFKKLLTLVKMAFSQRRKTLRNCLKPLLDAESLSDVYFNQRAEQLTVQDYLQLYKKIYG
jgi:16S rRNA (adenine1518-N6/adenine1519-N6)-dimethyltransferase